jgi:NitT/TauT family transport system permease protein
MRILTLRFWRERLLDSVGIAAFLAIWQIASTLRWLDPQFVPPPTKIVATVIELARSGELLTHTLASVQRVLTGFAMAVAIGIPLGFVVSGGLPLLARFLRPVFAVLGQVNAFSLFPLFILMFGIGEIAKLAIIFWSALFPVLFMTMGGAQNVDRALIKAARSMNATPSTIFFKVTVPASLPAIFTGIRMGGSISFLMLIAAEMAGASEGLGWLIHNSQVLYVIPRVFAAAGVIAVLGMLLNALLRFAEARAVSWQPKSQGGVHELSAT